MDLINPYYTRHIMNTQTSIVPVYYGSIAGEPAHIVKARELHTFLENGDKFATWIADRIEQYDFVENQDFIIFSENTEKPQRGRPAIEYHITLEMAKHLSMVERNEKGKQARRYFIDCEKNWLNHPIIALLNPKPEMTLQEYYQWRDQLRDELGIAVKNATKSINLTTTANDYLISVIEGGDRVMTKLLGA